MALLWEEKVIRKLLEAGYRGANMTEIDHVLHHSVPLDGVRLFLESLQIEHAVQKFTDGNATIWRATDKLPSIDV